MKGYRFLLPLLCALALISSLSWIMFTTNDVEAKTHFAMQGKSFPTFDSPTLSGAYTDQTLFQDEWKLLNVWASWCAICKQEHDFLMSLAIQDIPIIGLNYRDKKGAAINVLEKSGDPYQTVIFDPLGELALELGSIVTPETYLVDQDGTLIFRHSGILNTQVWQTEFLPRIEELNRTDKG